MIFQQSWNRLFIETTTNMSQQAGTFDHPFVVSYASVGIGVTASVIIPHVKKKLRNS